MVNWLILKKKVNSDRLKLIEMIKETTNAPRVTSEKETFKL